MSHKDVTDYLLGYAIGSVSASLIFGAIEQAALSALGVAATMLVVALHGRWSRAAEPDQ